MPNSPPKRKTSNLNKYKRLIERTNISNKKIDYNKCPTITDKPLSKTQITIETYNSRNSTMWQHPLPFSTPEDLKNTQDFNNSIISSLDQPTQTSHLMKESLRFQEPLEKSSWTKNSKKLCWPLLSKTETKRSKKR